MPCHVGTSGWQYRDWRGPVYPPGVPQRLWLEHYAERFATVEVNNSFYRLPEEQVFAAWARRTPDDFVVTVKASRFLTHIKRLRDPADPVELFVSRARGLGRKVGPVLVQLPPQFPVDEARLDETLALFGRYGLRVAVEPRHDSWFVPSVRALLERHGAAQVWSDRKSRPIAPCWRTADWGYLRCHEGASDTPPCYGDRALEHWAERLARTWSRDEDTYVYFNNDPRGCAVRDAARFARFAARAGLDPTRTPDARSVVPA